MKDLSKLTAYEVENLYFEGKITEVAFEKYIHRETVKSITEFERVQKMWSGKKVFEYPFHYSVKFGIR